MNINFEYYKVFYYVVNCKKISAAAEKLFVSQPAITQTIQKLEEQLGSTLLVRTKSGIELTETGKMLYDFIKESVEKLDNAEYRLSKYQNLEEGFIKIRAGSNTSKLVLYDALEEFGKKYPNIKVEITSADTSKSIEMLRTGEIDMVLAHLPYDVPYSNLEIIECAKEEFIFAMSKKYYEENKVHISKIEDLNNYSLIIPKKESSIRDAFDKNFKDKIYNYHYEITNEQMKKEFIKRDMGIGFMMRNEIEEELKSGELVEVKLKDIRVTDIVGAITLKKKFTTFATKKLIEYMKK